MSKVLRFGFNPSVSLATSLDIEVVNLGFMGIPNGLICLGRNPFFLLEFP